jgi:inorganic triphosphatase YgiF
LLLQTPWHTLDPQGEVFAALLPCFTTEFNRTLWQVSGADGSRIEVALDQGHVHSAGKTSPICELELELLAGQPAALFDLAQHIAASVAVLPATISKAQRGFALAQGTLLQPCPLKRISVHRGSGSPTPHAILGSAFGAICANLNTLMHTDDLAVVRQLRIGLRRFRAALRYFKPVLQHHTMPAMQLLLPLAHQLHSLEETTAAPQQRWQAMRQTLQQPQTGSQLLAICQWLEQMNG